MQYGLLDLSKCNLLALIVFPIDMKTTKQTQLSNPLQASERAAFARHIYERHFASNSTEPVNVDNSTSKRIRETMQGGKYPRNTFDLAQYQVRGAS